MPGRSDEVQGDGGEGKFPGAGSRGHTVCGQRGLPRHVGSDSEQLDFSYRRTDASVIRVFSDSDWAGFPRTRKSTGGGVMMFRGVAVKHWSSTQGSISLSSGEAEYKALVKAAVEGMVACLGRGGV